MKNLLALSQLSIKQILQLLDTAQKIKDHKINAKLANKKVANLFFEPSTRTHYSFITAEHNLGCLPIDFAADISSMLKGETFYDTVKVFDAFDVDAIVIRHSESAWYKQVLNKIKTPLINAGDGVNDHPTQSLLDLLTIQQQFKTFKGIKVLVVGDIVHSRVAHSNIDVMRRLGMKVYAVAPKIFQDKQYNYVDLDEYLPKIDVINMLRIQNERISERTSFNIRDYNRQYGLNMSRVKRMKPNAIIIHPAPFNRNVEIDNDVVECSRSRIFKQIENGVFVRMAVLLWVMKK